MHTGRRHGGWAFAIVLVALAIAALLARESLVHWLARTTDAVAARPVPGPAPAADPAQAAPQRPVERARDVESVVLKQAHEAARRIDDAAR